MSHDEEEESTTARTMRLIKAEWVSEERRRISERVANLLPGSNRRHHDYIAYIAGWQDALDAVLKDLAPNEAER